MVRLLPGVRYSNDKPMSEERIICAAIWFDDGKRHEHQPRNIDTGFVVCGRRHHNCFITASILKGEDWRVSDYGKNVQGFLTSSDLFLNRKKAAVVAYKSGQYKRAGRGDVLFSEDLY